LSTKRKAFPDGWFLFWAVGERVLLLELAAIRPSSAPSSPSKRDSKVVLSPLPEKKVDESS
jgi:hypothetical protein